jgi:hypothetical protein
MDSNKLKDGVSVKEIEAFAKKHKFEVFLCLSFIFACFFSFVFFGTGWAVILAAAGAIVGVLLPGKIEHFAKMVFHFIFKQEQMTQMILGIVLLVLSILIGLHGGKSMHHLALEVNSTHRK